MTSALIKIAQRHEDGQKVVEISLPRRVLTALRSMNPRSVRFTFGVNEEFEISSDELKRAIFETYKKNSRRKGIIEKRESKKREVALALRAQKEAAEAKAVKKKGVAG